jgi:hypothetical protein
MAYPELQMETYSNLGNELEAFDEAKIEDGKRGVVDLERKIKNLRREKDALASESEERMALKLKRDELADKETSLQKMFVTCLLKNLSPALSSN